jgi:hypothetical protein
VSRQGRCYFQCMKLSPPNLARRCSGKSCIDKTLRNDLQFTDMLVLPKPVFEPLWSLSLRACSRVETHVKQWLKALKIDLTSIC